MNNTKIYTAQEMRDMAECISHIKQSEMSSWKEGKIITGGDLCRSAEMLRQAADIRERCEKAKCAIDKRNNAFRNMWGCDDSVDGSKLIDYILRGAQGRRRDEQNYYMVYGF